MSLNELSREALVEMIRERTQLISEVGDFIYDYCEIDPNDEHGLQRYDSLTSEIERILK